MNAYIHNLLIFVCCAQGQIYPFFFLSNLFPVSLFLKCPVVSCVQIIIINIKDWTSLIRFVSRVTTVLANVSLVFQLFSFLVDCSGMISTGL